MKKPPPADNRIFSLFLLLPALFAFCFCSCSDDAVDVTTVSANLILDWQDERSLPEERLSVFVEVSSNARRVESFSVKSGDYTWNVESPILFQDQNRQWAGWPHLSPPPGSDGERGLFPLGEYLVECVDAAGKKDTATFSIVINAALLDSDPRQAESILYYVTKKVAVYSESNELLYFDAAKNNWFDDAAIFAGVNDSAFYRNTLSSGSALCLMPKIFKESKDGKKSDGLEF